MDRIKGILREIPTLSWRAALVWFGGTGVWFPFPHKLEKMSKVVEKWVGNKPEMLGVLEENFLFFCTISLNMQPNMERNLFGTQVSAVWEAASFIGSEEWFEP